MQALGQVDYSSAATPAGYCCGECGATGVKLWREYQTFLSHQRLLCLACGCKDENKERTPTADGRSLHTGVVQHWYRTASDQPGWGRGYDPKNGVPADAVKTWSEGERCDQIGNLVPAIPTEDGETFWGYSSVPQDGCEWWYRLPYAAGGP